MSADIVRGNAPGMKMLNIDKLATNPYGTIDVEPPWRDGVSAAPDAGPWRFPDFCEPPRLLFDKKLGRPPRDLEDYNAYWLVSAALKDVLDALDPDAFDYRACETVLPTGEAGPKRWLCTVTRAFLGSVDVEASENLLTRRGPDGRTIYTPTPLTKLKLKAEVVGAARFFHIVEVFEKAVYCDQVVRDACKTAKVTGLGFGDDIEAL